MYSTSAEYECCLPLWKDVHWAQSSERKVQQPNLKEFGVNMLVLDTSQILSGCLAVWTRDYSKQCAEYESKFKW